MYNLPFHDDYSKVVSPIYSRKVLKNNNNYLIVGSFKG